MALAVALTALAAGGAAHLGHDGPSAGATTDLGRAVGGAARRGGGHPGGRRALRPPRCAGRRGSSSGWRQASFAGGVAVLLIAVCSPLGGVAQQGLLSAHMLQHTLIGAVAPLLLLLGMPRAFLEAVLSPAWRRRPSGSSTRSSPSRSGSLGRSSGCSRPSTTRCSRARRCGSSSRRPSWSSGWSCGRRWWRASRTALVLHGLEVRLHGRRLGGRPFDRQRLLVLGDAPSTTRTPPPRRPGASRRSRTRPTPGP